MYRETDLFRAIYNLNAYQVRILLDAGCPHRMIDERGWSFLHVAVDMAKNATHCSGSLAQAKSDIIYMLIDAGIDLEAKDKDGNTCLWYAVRNNDSKSCDILLQNGADMHSTCETGNSILSEVFSVPPSVDGNGEYHYNDLQEVFKQYYV